MQSTQEKLHPMTVVTMANARVYDLIGLICWQYTCEGREPKLTLVEKSFLHMHPIEEVDISTYSSAWSVKVKLGAWLDIYNLKHLGAHKDFMDIFLFFTVIKGNNETFTFLDIYASNFIYLIIME